MLDLDAVGSRIRLMRNLPVEYDDLFIYAPSFLAWERGLQEGKAVGTAAEQDLVLLDLDKTIKAYVDPEGYAKERKSGVTVGKRVLKRVQSEVEPALMKAITRFQNGKTDAKAFRAEMVKVMKPAWRDVFIAGVRAAGHSTKGPGLVSFTDPNDEKWLKGAMAHEMQFLNGMIEAVVEETWVMPLPRRVRMYVDALESFYDSARVIGLPAATIIHWKLGKHDSKVCASCEYLEDNSPYSKKTLPTVPRSGLTICLTNCRDRLLVRMTTAEKAVALHQGSPTRGTHIRKLRRIKQLGHG